MRFTSKKNFLFPYYRDPREPVKHCLTMGPDHPKVQNAEALRMEHQLAQMENYQNFSDYQRRRKEFRPDETPRPNRKILDDVVS